MPAAFRYNTIGQGYARTRREEPVIRSAVHAALGPARTVLNVGAGAGSYEPRDRQVIAIEPSEVMIAQRPPELTPAVCATATQLPLKDHSVDAAMALLTLHHWDDQPQGLLELRRVSRGPVVVLTYDANVCGQMWLTADYLPEIAAMDRDIFPAPQQIQKWLGGETTVEVIPIPRTCQDWMLGSFWAHPERVLDADARASTSGFARLSSDIVEAAVNRLSRDLDSGEWDRRYGHLRNEDAWDAGLRLVVASAPDS